MLSNSVSAAAAKGDKRSILWVARTSLLRTVLFDTLRRASSMRFDGFVRVLRVFLTQTELFLHYGIHETKKQSAGFFYFFILEDFDRLEFLFSR